MRVSEILVCWFLGMAEWSELPLVKLVEHHGLCYMLSLVGSHFCFLSVGVLEQIGLSLIVLFETEKFILAFGTGNRNK